MRPTATTDDDLEKLVATAARDVHRRFRGFVDREDLLSEGWLYVYEHPRRMSEYDTDENRKRAGYRLRRDLSMRMERYARDSKAFRLGYAPEDEQFYSSHQVRTLVSLAFSGHPASPNSLSERRVWRDPAEGGDLTTSVLDVLDAWGRLTDDERALLFGSIICELTQRELATIYEVDPSTISRRIRNALKKMVDLLGGLYPHGCPYTCECHEGPLRQRPGVRTPTSGMNQVAL